MHVAAEGPLKTLILLSLAFAVVVAGGSYLDPFTRMYEVKTIARVACNDLAAEKRYKRDTKWEDTFVRKARALGVPLKPGQYRFDMTLTVESNTCDAEVAWRERMPVFLLGDAFDIQPIEFVQRVTLKHAVKASWK